jgi:hypothetical protein
VDTSSQTAPEVIMNSTLTPVAPTAPQIDYLMRLLDELALYRSVTGESVEKLREGYREQYRAHTLTKTSISAEFDILRELIRTARKVARDTTVEVPAQDAQQPTSGRPIALVPAGRYAITGGEGQTVFVHVVKFESGAFIVKQQVGDDTHRVPKVIAHTMLQKIVDAGIEEASMRYGRELGICGVCGRTLTNEDSRQRGIGPICAARLAG